jgi:hypothetical protein
MGIEWGSKQNAVCLAMGLGCLSIKSSMGLQLLNGIPEEDLIVQTQNPKSRESVMKGFYFKSI